MIKREEGFTLVELMVTMVIFVMAIAAASTVFTSLLTQFKQQSKVAESNVEGIVGLAVLKQDIESAGYGLFWNPNPLPVNYTESGANPFNLNDAPNKVPRAVASEDNAAFSAPNDIFNGSDYLVVKSMSVARNNASEKWTMIKDPNAYPYASPDSYNPRVWTDVANQPIPSENLKSDDRVIVFAGATKTVERALVTSGGAFYTTYSSITSDPWQPQDTNEARLIYGINGSTASAPVRPFNRADYYIARPANIPGRCAPNTGILYKATMNHDGAGSFTQLPLLDCVADMQVMYGLDMSTDADKGMGTYTNADGTFVIDFGDPPQGATIAKVQETLADSTLLRSRLNEVRVYILAHEGQMDRNYQYPNPSLTYPRAPDLAAGAGRTFNLAASIGPDYVFYRWKLYTVVAKPMNLR